jgi:hypothetical protein
MFCYLASEESKVKPAIGNIFTSLVCTIGNEIRRFDCGCMEMLCGKLMQCLWFCVVIASNSEQLNNVVSKLLLSDVDTVIFVVCF